MSHLTKSEIVINDLDILRKAVAGFPGLIWKEGQTQFRAYYNNDRQIAEIDGTCEHAIGINGCTYEVGVVRRKDGQGWSLVFDPYEASSRFVVGNNCEKIAAAYSDTYIRDFAERHGFQAENTVDDEGNTVITINVGA